VVDWQEGLVLRQVRQGVSDNSEAHAASIAAVAATAASSASASAAASAPAQADAGAAPGLRRWRPGQLGRRQEGVLLRACPEGMPNDAQAYHHAMSDRLQRGVQRSGSSSVGERLVRSEEALLL